MLVTISEKEFFKLNESGMQLDNAKRITLEVKYQGRILAVPFKPKGTIISRVSFAYTLVKDGINQELFTKIENFISERELKKLVRKLEKIGVKYKLSQ